MSSSLLPQCEYWKLSSGFQAQWQKPLPPETSPQSSIFLFCFNLFLFMCMSVYLNIYMYTAWVPAAHRGQKRTLYPLGQRLLAATWALGTES